LSEQLIRRVLILGSLAIAGVIAVQSYWLLKTWDVRDNDFDRSVNIALRNVAQLIARKNKTVLPTQNLIQRISSNVYSVNVNSKINDINFLEKLLYQEIADVYINTDFEYAVYDCATGQLIYGNYCKMGSGSPEKKRSSLLPKFNHLDYYFVIKFPERESYVVGNIWINILIGTVAILSVLFFTYSILVILRQKRLSEHQKDFINNMTHEFKTPISSIKIASEVLQSDQNIQQNTRLNRYATIIKEQNARLNEQVEKVLNVTRLENDTLKLNKTDIDLNDLLHSVVEANELKTGKGNITLEEGIHHVKISADKLHLTNVMYNIIDNAIKYCTKEPVIKLSLKSNEKGVALSISDNGIGISKENIKYLFEKFYRVNTGNVHDVKGFGLGLFYVKSICQAHGWTIDVKSEINKGSTFTIVIPDYKVDNTSE
jgi:two-component system phosphate regulon sensor histidine kinase PhoR